MRQVIKHREIKLLKMIRRTDPVIHCMILDSFNVFKTTKEAVSIVNLFTPKTAQAPFFLLFSLRFRRKCVYLQR